MTTTNQRVRTVPQAGPDAFTRMRRSILLHLDGRGPVPLPQIPAAWPMTRAQVRLVALEMLRDGVIEALDGDTGQFRLVRITQAGRDELLGRAA